MSKLGDGIPKPDGTIDYFGMNDPIRRPRQRCQGYTFSLNIFEWQSGKMGKPIRVVRGSCDCPEYAYRDALIAVRNPYPLEVTEQKIIIKWAIANRIKYPALRYLTASLNGFIIGKATVAEAKAQGMIVGEPDLRLLCARRGYHSLSIELKRVKNGSVSKEQKEYLAWLESEKNLAKVCKGSAEAIKLLEWYLT